jgi:hypothetical protein
MDGRNGRSFTNPSPAVRVPLLTDVQEPLYYVLDFTEGERAAARRARVALTRRDACNFVPALAVAETGVPGSLPITIRDHPPFVACENMPEQNSDHAQVRKIKPAAYPDGYRSGCKHLIARTTYSDNDPDFIASFAGCEH